MASKAGNLQQLTDAGFNVPPFISIASNLDSNQIISIVTEGLNGINLFAVRSSASVEDSKSKSYAGHFYSEVGVTFESLYKAYQKVVESYKGESGDVIVQEFIPSDCAGVLFTNDGSGLMVANSNHGLCKTVVDGQACDEWYISRDGKVMRKHIAPIKNPLHFENGIFSQIENPQESLNQYQISQLVEAGLKIEAFFGAPQDIEWCFRNNQLYILQSRPITRYTSQNRWIFYDSANIAESYSGVVLPLTHSFAANIYQKVYENLLIASGASRRRIARNQHIFSNMVSNFYGRMYYNMNNWYLMMSFMPGYKRNKGNLEEMLTMNVRVDVPRSVLPSFWLKVGYRFIVIFKLIIFNRTISRFKDKVKRELKRFRSEPIEKYDAQKCIEIYKYLESELLEQFHIPVENDFLMMTFLGILRKKYSDEELKPLIAFDNVSSRQIDSIVDLSKSIFEIPQLAEAVESNNTLLFTEILPLFPQVFKKYNNYFELYGGRFANELKLESADIEFESDVLFNLVKTYRNFKVDESSQHNLKSEKKNFVLRRFVKYAQQREELRLLRSNCFSLVRRIFRRVGVLLSHQGVIGQPADIFYLTVGEVVAATSEINQIDYKPLVDKRKNEYEGYKTIDPPSFFTVIDGGQPIFEQTVLINSKNLLGRSCTPGVVKGRVRVFDEFALPPKIDFDIMVARNTDPGWAALIGLSKGIIVENGGILSHAAIVSRELGIPTVIGVANITRLLKTGQIVEINGGTGEVRVVS